MILINRKRPAQLTKRFGLDHDYAWICRLLTHLDPNHILLGELPQHNFYLSANVTLLSAKYPILMQLSSETTQVSLFTKILVRIRCDCNKESCLMGTGISAILAWCYEIVIYGHIFVFLDMWVVETPKAMLDDRTVV